LAYAVRDADCVSTDGSNCWLDLKTNDGTTKTETESLSKCDNAAESDADKCYTTNSEGTKVFNSEKALSSIFGYGEDGADGTKTFNSIKLNANVNDNNVKTYDLVLFIKENWSPQNSDQGARYNGSITVEVAGAGIITGRIE